MFGFDFMFSVFPIIFIIMFTLIFGIFIVNIISGIRTWKKNNDSPRLRVRCKIVDKRQDIRRNTHHNANDHTSHTTTSSSYYVTFEVESGDRMVLQVPREEYGYLVEGDEGMLSFQGTRYLGFERER